jgi:hypothetical protein
MRMGITTYLKPSLSGMVIRRRAVAVLQVDLDHVLAHVGQRVDQVGDVEADLDAVAAVVDVELVLGLFLLGVVAATRRVPGSMFRRTPLNLSLVRMAVRCRLASSGARPR